MGSDSEGYGSTSAYIYRDIRQHCADAYNSIHGEWSPEIPDIPGNMRVIKMIQFGQINIAIIGIIILEISMGAFAYMSGESPDIGTIGMGIAGIAGLAGYDMRQT